MLFDEKEPKLMQAIILVGGLGTRLRSVVNNVPKVLAPVGGRPFLAWLLDGLVLDGFKVICLATGYLGNQIFNEFGNSHRCGPQSAAIVYSHEAEPIGTGGAIRLALHQLSEKSTFVLNGDTFLRPDWYRMSDLHAEQKSHLTIAVRHVEDVSRYGGVEINEGVVVSFREKKRNGPGFINAGVYLLDRCIFDCIPETFAPFSIEQDVIEAHLHQLTPRAFVTDSPFLDIGIPEDLLYAPEFLLAHCPSYRAFDI